jgi:hypothetical protein
MLGFVVIVIGCVAFAFAQHERNQPTLNPHPKYYVTVSGNIAPDLPHPMYMAFWATYGGYNPKCKVWVNFLEGIPGMPGHPDFYPVKPDAKGNYIVKIPIDRYKPGRCDWKIAWIDFSFGFHPFVKDKGKAGGFGAIIQFGYYPEVWPAFPIDKEETLHGCEDVKFDRCKGFTLQAGSTKFVSRRESYFFVQNIKK